MKKSQWYWLAHVALIVVLINGLLELHARVRSHNTQH